MGLIVVSPPLKEFKLPKPVGEMLESYAAKCVTPWKKPAVIRLLGLHSNPKT